MNGPKPAPPPVCKWPAHVPLDDPHEFERALVTAGYRPRADLARSLVGFVQEFDDPDWALVMLFEAEVLDSASPTLLADGLGPYTFGSRDASVLTAATDIGSLRQLFAVTGLGFPVSSPHRWIEHAVDSVHHRLGWTTGQAISWMLEHDVLELRYEHVDRLGEGPWPSLPLHHRIAFETFLRQTLAEEMGEVRSWEEDDDVVLQFPLLPSGDHMQIGSAVVRGADGRQDFSMDPPGVLRVPKDARLTFVPWKPERYGDPFRGIPPDLFARAEVPVGPFDEPFNDEDVLALRHMTGLEELAVNFSIVEGLAVGGRTPSAITDRGLALLQQFPRLRELHLRAKAITDDGLAALSGLALEAVSFGNGSITSLGLASVVGEQTRSVRLDITSEPIGDCAWLNQTPALSTLDLCATGLHDEVLDPIARLPLHYLSLGEHRRREANSHPAFQAGWVGNHTLELAGRIPGLGELHLFSTEIDDDGIPAIVGLPALRVLDVAWTVITDVALESIADIASLRELRLDGTSVTNRGLARLEGMGLQKLSLNDVDASDGCLGSILKLRDLEHLDLTGTRVTIKGMAKLRRLRHLKRLDLYHFDSFDDIRRVERKLPGVEIKDSLM